MTPRLRLAATLAALTALVLGAAPAALAAEATPEAAPVSWSVAPANETEPDGRSWVELELEPGETADEHLAIRNLGSETVTFRIDAADGYFTPTGRFSMLPSSTPSTEAGTWIEAPESVTIDAGGLAVLPFTVTVPENAEPGDHAAGVAASVLSTGTGEDGSSVGVESRVGFRVMTRVEGDVAPSLLLRDVEAVYNLSWNPFAPGSIELTGEAVNDGNVRLLVDGEVSAGGSTVTTTETTEAPQELLPGDARSLSARIDGVWPLVAVGTDLRVSPTVVTLDGEQTEIDAVTTNVVAWAVPWPQLIVLLGIALIVVAIFGGRIRSRRRMNTMLEKAREEGRLAALETERSQNADAESSGTIR